MDFLPKRKPTHIKNYGTVICVAGGYGAAPCYLIAKAFKEAGNKVYMIMGARNKDLLFWQDKMATACSELHIATDDGTGTDKLLGIVTSRDYRVSRMDPTTPVSAFMTPLEKLVYAPEGTSLKEANDVLAKVKKGEDFAKLAEKAEKEKEKGKAEK